MVPQPTSMRPMPVARTTEATSPRLKTMSADGKTARPGLMPAPGFRQVRGPVQFMGRERRFFHRGCVLALDSAC